MRITQAPDWPAHPLNRGFDYYYGYIRHADGHEHYPKEGSSTAARKKSGTNRTRPPPASTNATPPTCRRPRKEWIIDHNARPAPAAILPLPRVRHTARHPGAADAALPGRRGPSRRPAMARHARPHDQDRLGRRRFLDAPRLRQRHLGRRPQSRHARRSPGPTSNKRYATSVPGSMTASVTSSNSSRTCNSMTNTLLVFTSDNGPSIESYLKEPYAPTFFGSFGPFDGIKRDCWEGGMRVPSRPLAGRDPRRPGDRRCLPHIDWMPDFRRRSPASRPPRARMASPWCPRSLARATSCTARLVYSSTRVAGRTPDFPVRARPSDRCAARCRRCA